MAYLDSKKEGGTEHKGMMLLTSRIHSCQKYIHSGQLTKTNTQISRTLDGRILYSDETYKLICMVGQSPRYIYGSMS